MPSSRQGRSCPSPMPFGLSSEVGSAVSVATCCKGSEGAAGRTKEHPTACAVSKCSSILARPGHAGRSTSTRRRRSARLKPYLAASVTEQKSRYFSRCVCKFTSSAAPPSCPEMQENGLRIAGPVFLRARGGKKDSTQRPQWCPWLAGPEKLAHMTEGSYTIEQDFHN